VQTAFRFFASGVEFSHGLLMVLWALGLPLLFWHRYARLSRAYVGFSLVFIIGSVVSHVVLGECVLTTVARASWQLAGRQTENVPFIVTFTNWVAGVRPGNRAAVLTWQVAIVMYCLASLWGSGRLARKSADPFPPGGAPGRNGAT
jgi:hypothetical protein